MAGIWHPRTGFTAFLLLLSATTELVIINLIPQHDPQPDPEFASHRHSRLPQTFLDQFAAVETLQLRIPAYRVCRRFTPEKPQPPSTGVFTRNHPHITSQGLAVSESCCIAQEYLGRQRRNRSHSRVSHQQPCSGTFQSLLLNSLV